MFPSFDCIDEFLANVRTDANHVAISNYAEQVSYGELERRVRRIAAVVARRTEQRVLIALPQGTDAYAAMLGVGLGGGYYAPVNLDSPRAKIELIVREFVPDLIIGRPADKEFYDSIGSGSRFIDTASVADTPPYAGQGERSKIAYVIFTSGSTGTPKGVVISRVALNHYIAAIGPILEVRPGDRVSQHPNIAFDLSVMEIYGALCYGATLCPIITRGDRLFPARAVAREKMTLWVSVPSVVSLMVKSGDVTAEKLKSLRLLCFCGEPLLTQHLEAIFAACPSAVVVNAYGPTEATVSVTSLRLTVDDYRFACFESVAIGNPIPGMGLHLVGGDQLDEGEIVITGPQLANEYWNDPAKTSRSFRELSLSGKSVRAYFSGDWAVKREGHYIVKGRLDFQVKLHGHRLELDEVSSAIRSAGFADVCVLLWRNQLVAVVEAGAQSSYDEDTLRHELSLKLESHAIPVAIILMPAIPRNENDKVDMAAVSRWLDSRENQ